MGSLTQPTTPQFHSPETDNHRPPPSQLLFPHPPPQIFTNMFKTC